MDQKTVDSKGNIREGKGPIANIVKIAYRINVTVVRV